MALIPHIQHPLLLERPCARAGFATHDDPVDRLQVQFRQRPEQRLQRQELDACASLPEVVDPVCIVLILDADSHPDVIRPLDLRVELQQAIRALGENLEGVP